MARKAKGKRLTKTGRYTIEATTGKKRRFAGRLRYSEVVGGVRIAVFTVPKKFS
jgi:hypothetical protein